MRRAFVVIRIGLVTLAALMCASVVTEAARSFALQSLAHEIASRRSSSSPAPSPSERAFDAAPRLFGVSGSATGAGLDSDDDGRAAATSCADAPLSARELRLVGTVVAEAGALSAASIARGSDSAVVVRVGDTVDGASVRAIDVDGVCLRGGHGVERLVLAGPARPHTAPPAASVRVVDGRVEVPRAALAQVLADPLSLARDVRFAPALRDGKSVGFRAVYVRPGSALAGAGLVRGDVVMRVNGYALSDLASALALLQNVKDVSRFTVELERAGAEVSVDVDVR